MGEDAGERIIPEREECSRVDVGGRNAADYGVRGESVRSM